MPNEKPQQGIWQKRMALQTKVKTFNVSENSEKKDASNRSAYRYTPGYQIVETLRAEMDPLGLMLIPEFRAQKIETIEYPVYKLIGGSPMSFMKKEVHFVVDADFLWIDTVTGEKAGPFHIVASGANGTDKSCASALALAERYFLLKFFHITTHDEADEPDAHDSDTVPGIPKEVQQPASRGAACAAVPVQPAYQPGQNGSYAPSGYAPQGGMPAYQGGQPRQQGPGQQVNVYTAPPQYIQGAPVPPVSGGGFNENHPLIRQAIEKLMVFDRGTMSHKQVLNECIGLLSSNGINCTDASFIENLSEAAQARRENRSARFV